MTSKSLPAPFGFGTLWEETHVCCGLPFRKNFYLVIWTPWGCGFRCFQQKWPHSVVTVLQIFPQSATGAWQHTLVGPHCTLVPKCFSEPLLWGPASWVLCPAAAPSIFWVGGDVRHNLSYSRTAEVIIFLQPVLEAESQWVWFRPWIFTQGNFERCEVKKDPQLLLPP